MYDVFTRDDEAQTTRHGVRYIWNCTVYGHHPGTFYASVRHTDDMSVCLHSHAPMPEEDRSLMTFEEALQSFGDGSLWENLHYDGDGEWIRLGLLMGSLCIVHDGSYMEDLSEDACSAGIQIYCMITKQKLRCGVAEQSISADNYRGEILGAVICQLILKAATLRRCSPFKEVTIYCDNQGVLTHGNSPNDSLLEKQAQSDLLRHLKLLIRENPFNTKYRWVEGHAFEARGWKACNLQERLNHKADRLAKAVLISAVKSAQFINLYLPFEQITVTTDQGKATGSLVRSCTMHWGTREARVRLDKACIVSSYNFDKVWWKGLGLAMKRSPKMYRMWLTKQVAECAGTNMQLSYWDKTNQTDNRCPHCKEALEYTMHMTRCTHPGRRKMLRYSVNCLAEWMYDTFVDPIVVDMVRRYLLGQGSVLMTNCLEYDSEQYMAVATATDDLRWDSFVEGRISPLWLDIMKPILMENKSVLFLTPERWGAIFIEHLVSITHKQWIFRNSKVHFKKDGHTEAEHERIFDKVEELMKIDPDDLLPCHKHLLEVDFHALGKGKAVGRKYWIGRMEAAIQAHAKVKSGYVVPGSQARMNTSVSVQIRAETGRNGSIVYRQRCRRSNPCVR